MAEPTQDQVTADGHLIQSEGDNSANELCQMVDDLMDNLTAKFSVVSAEICAKMDDMSRRLDELEASINTSAAPANHVQST
ncbi:MAG: hypothetical protein MMC33_005942 [Icmadophila ericetorum]|nr:hypothetical protein [Icmadophila ericetorum]